MRKPMRKACHTAMFLSLEDANELSPNLIVLHKC